MSEGTMFELDREMVRLLGTIHPTHISRLSFQALVILAGTTGIDPNYAALAPLALARSADDLVRVEWDHLLAAVAPHSRLSENSLVTIFLHLRLFTERAALHTCLYRSRSASTLWSLGTWPLPRHGWPAELSACYGEFEQACREADAALQGGRACLQNFARLLPRERTFDLLQELLRHANTCYARYLQALLQADQLAGAIKEYLAETRETVNPPDDEDTRHEERRVA
jgi:hypothetical protein